LDLGAREMAQKAALLRGAAVRAIARAIRRHPPKYKAVPRRVRI